MPLLPFLAVLAMPPSTPTAEEILNRCESAYAKLSTYSDTGTIQSTIVNDGKREMNDIRRFRTWFSRPGKLRFEFIDPPAYREPNPKWVVWGNKGAYRLWTTYSRGSAEKVTLFDVFQHRGIIGASDVANIAIKFFFPEVHLAETVTTMEDPKLETSVTIDGAGCFAVSTSDWPGAKTTLSIDQKTYLIRRWDDTLEEKHDGVKEINRTTVFLKPVPNPKLGKADLSYTPPKR